VLAIYEHSPRSIRSYKPLYVSILFSDLIHDLDPARSEQFNSQKFTSFIEVGKGVATFIFSDLCGVSSTHLKISRQERASFFIG